MSTEFIKLRMYRVIGPEVSEMMDRKQKKLSRFHSRMLSSKSLFKDRQLVEYLSSLGFGFESNDGILRPPIQEMTKREPSDFRGLSVFCLPKWPRGRGRH